MLGLSALLGGMASTGGAQTLPEPNQALLAQAAVGRPRLSVNTQLIEPESIVQVTFAQPMVLADEVGKATAVGMLEISPAWPGEFRWKLENVAQFYPSEPPKMGERYEFKIGENQTYLDGSKLTAGAFGFAVARAFGFSHMADQYNALSLNSRQPRVRLTFVDDPVVAAENFAFVNSAGLKVAAEVLPFVPEEQKQLGYIPPLPWSKRWQALQQAAPKDTPSENAPDAKPTATPLAHVHFVRPAEPLPLGSRWKLMIEKEIVSAVGGHKIPCAEVCVLGDVARQRLLEASAEIVVNRKPELVLRFLKQLDASADFTQSVRVSPEVAGLRWETKGNVLVGKGEFYRKANYLVSLGNRLPCADGIVDAEPCEKSVKFTPLPPSIGLESFTLGQYAHGKRTYEIGTCNLANLQVRVKQMSGSEAIRAYQTYLLQYQREKLQPGQRSNLPQFQTPGPLPYHLVGGKTIYERAWQWKDEGVDHSHHVTLHWDKMLPPKSPAMLLLAAQGTASSGGLADPEATIAQSIVQLSDIGLAWKLRPQEALVYVFSLSSGQPLAGAKLALYGPDATERCAFLTNSDGIATVPRGGGAAGEVLAVSQGSDLFLIDWSNHLPEIPRYRFPIDISWRTPTEFERQVFMFTDRGLYRPGETVHLKGIVRRRLDTALKLPLESTAEFVLLDSKSQELVRKQITLTEHGSFAETLTLPQDTVGLFCAQLEFPKPLAEAPEPSPEDPAYDPESLEYDEEGRPVESHVFRAYFSVEEFRKNAFEIFLTSPKPPVGGQTVAFPLEARYFMGQNLSDAKVNWHAQIRNGGFYPDHFRDFLFGDHEDYDPYYWAHYFGYGGDSYRYYISSDHRTGELALGKDGKANIEVSLLPQTFPAPRQVRLSAEITDVNQQTLSARTSAMVHCADFYLGIRRIDRLVREKESVELDVQAVAADGQLWTEDVAVQMTVEQQAWRPVTIRAADGSMKTLNQNELAVVHQAEFTLAGGRGQKIGATHFQVQAAGRHLVTLRAKDKQGRETATRIHFYAYGAGEYAWAHQQGNLIKLVPERPSYRPGDVAKILVQTPVDGHALVTVERSGVLRSFVRLLNSQQPIVEIPVTQDDSPNVYVSVTLIKGGEENQRAAKDPIVKLGYCKLQVENTKDRLKIEVAPVAKTYRPATEAEIQGVVTDAAQNPASGAEVTLWAVDEGVLSVMGYANPDPLKALLPDLPLAVRSGSSLPLLLPETENWEYPNKGFVVGDGGENEFSTERPRTDFNPLAFWKADLKTDAAGRFYAKFPLPDNLTRYRILAVALHGARKMGLGVSSMTVNKPIMIEPVIPRFANVGDKIVTKAVIHNTSQASGVWTVTMETNDHSRFLESAGPEMTKELQLAAGETKAVPFEMETTRLGEVVWRWRAKPREISVPEGGEAAHVLTDSVEQRFPVQYPAPLLAEVHYFTIEGGTQTDLAKAFDPGLAKSPTKVEIEISTSRLVEAAEAVNYNLHYPYG